MAVVGDVRAMGPEQEPIPEVYVPLNEEVWGNITVVVRARDVPSELLGAIRQSLQAIDRTIPVELLRFLTPSRAGGPDGDR